MCLSICLSNCLLYALRLKQQQLPKGVGCCHWYFWFWFRFLFCFFNCCWLNGMQLFLFFFLFFFFLFYCNLCCCYYFIFCAWNLIFSIKFFFFFLLLSNLELYILLAMFMGAEQNWMLRVSIIRRYSLVILVFLFWFEFQFEF